MEETNKKSRGKKNAFTAIVIGVVTVFALGFVMGCKYYEAKNMPEITNDYIAGKLEDVGELTTQKLTYTGFMTISEGKISIINKKQFSMKYVAIMRAGMEFDEFDINIKDNMVFVKIPHADILDVKIDSSTIQFYDEKFTLFNKSTKEDVAKAITIAEEDVLEKTDYSELLEKADEHAEELIYELLDGAVGDKSVVVLFK